MDIKLSNEYRITSDGTQFIAQTMTVTKASKQTLEANIGKEKWTDIGYYTKMNQVLRCIANHIPLANKDLDVIITKLNLLDIKIDEIRELLENTRIKDLIDIKITEPVEEVLLESEEY